MHIPKEQIFKYIAMASAGFLFVMLLAIFISLYMQAKPAVDEFGLGFLTEERWGETEKIENDSSTKAEMTETFKSSAEDEIIDEDDIIDEDEEMLDDVAEGNYRREIYGGLAPIVGTLLSTLIAMVLATPIALGIAIFLAEIAPNAIKTPFGIAIELLAAIPSIIYGMWGLFYLAPIIQAWFGGYPVSLLIAGVVLGIMILPFMAAITRDSINTTPDVLKESAYALGATKFEVIKDVIFPYAKIGIIGSIILALGRALGETMAVAFLIGSIFKLPSSLTDQTITISVAMANNFGEADGMGESALFYLAMILFVISFSVISIAKFYFTKERS